MDRKIVTARSLLTMMITVFLALPNHAGAENPVVGVLLSLSGPGAAIGHMQKNAMLLAVEEINGKGVLDAGRVLELDIRNAGGRPGDIRNIVNHFIRDKQYPVLISGGASRVASQAARWCQRGLTPLIVITGSEDSITRDGLDHVFRIAPPRSRYGDAAFEFAGEVLRPEKVAAVMERSDFGKSMMDVLEKTAAGFGWDLVRRIWIDPGNADLEEIRAGLGGIDTDVVFLTVFPPEATRIMAEIHTLGSGEMTVISLVPSSVTADAFLACGADCRGVYSTALWFGGADGSAESFQKRYLEKYGAQPDYHAAQAYAAVLAAASALRKADEPGGDAVRSSLRGMRIGSPLGTVSFRDWDGFENQNRPASYLFQWSGERFEVIRPDRYRMPEPAR